MKKNGFSKKCKICQKEFYVSLSRSSQILCGYDCYIKNKKGKSPWNKGKKIGIMPNRHFKKGYKHTAKWYKVMIGRMPWNKGLKGYNSGEKNPSWKGGKQTSGNGYIYLYQPNHPFSDKRGRVYEHRIIMEKKIGRYLLPEEVVDHINEIRTDNRPENLRLFKSNLEHLQITKGLFLTKT